MMIFFQNKFSTGELTYLRRLLVVFPMFSTTIHIFMKVDKVWKADMDN